MIRATTIVLTLITALLTQGAFASVQNFTDSDSYAVEKQDQKFATAYFEMLRKLEDQFDYVCGDTFCEGDYSDLRSLDLTCAVAPGTGQIQSCLWTFAGSSQVVDERTGQIAAQGTIFKCPFEVKSTIETMVNAVNHKGYDLTSSVLPGMKTSLYDMLVGCL